ncbi:MAG TPA: hypothetical protein VFO34_17635 [Candidatus Acidoferrales bacterium]|nr:hypothetical protein [Candidatus Acidoferrales bacterium]
MNPAPANPKMARALRVSGLLLVIGLLIELISLHFNHPLSFLGFMFVGGGLIVLGVLVYLWALVSLAPSDSSTP